MPKRDLRLTKMLFEPLLDDSYEIRMYEMVHYAVHRGNSPAETLLSRRGVAGLQ